MLKRPSATEAGQQVPYDPSKAEVCKLSKTLPTFCEFLAREAWPDGEPRERGTILLVFQDSRWRAWVNDKDTQRSAWVSAESIQGVLEAVEKGLLNDSLGWRQDRPPARRGK